ncbi:MAG: LamG domain-containing protein, partial [Fluviicola sp.]|nr:LamG domain-containing protein [Fluviicola sp.]
MKKLLFIPLLLIGFKAVAQDTTWVQTFTFDTIETRRANFQFPASLDTMRFEKVLMYYKLKCSPLTTWDQYNCGEWDYLTYTRIYDHTGLLDSVRVDGPNFRVNTHAPASYAYTSQAYFDQQWKAVSRRTPNVAVTNTMTGTAGTPITFLTNATNGGKMQWIIPAASLATSGVVAGDIQGMELSLLNNLSQIQGVQIRIKSTNLSSLTAFETTGFTTVFDDEWNNLAIGASAIHFSNPFVYDGTSNLIIEISFTEAYIGLPAVNFATFQPTATENTLVYSDENGVFRTTASDFAEINLSNVDLGGDVTIAFWSKGNGSYGTNTSVLEAVDSLNNRIFNIHFPWSDNNIYFDAGEGAGYDRISKAATNNDIETWHHWAFVKKTSTGQMFIYKDGVLWHQGTGMNRPVGKVARFILGSNWNQQYQYKGDIDEFSVWTSALDAATISAWKNKKIDASHPNYSNLEVYYDFDGQKAMIDRSGNNRLGMCSDIAMIQHGVEPVAGITSVATVPQVNLIQGTYNAATSDSILNVLFPETSVVFEYAPSDNSFHVTSNYLSYSEGTIDTLSVAGVVIDNTPSTVETTLVKDTITYYQTPFENINEVEIGRYITPYGIGFDLGPQGFTWIYDVTDYQKYLHGLVDLGAHNTQELLDLKFAFIEG